MIIDPMAIRKIILKTASFLIVATLVLAGCAAPATPEQNEVATTAPEMPAQKAVPSEAPPETNTAAPTLEPAPADPLAGLVYLSDDRLWLVGQDGQAAAILDQASYTTPSKDGVRVLYAGGDPGDLYLKDLATGETRQLTDTPTISERFPRFLKGTSKVIYHFVSVDEMGQSAGYLGQLDLVSGETIPLDSRNSSGTPFVLSPDGTKIAYGGAPAMIYTWNGGAQPLQPQAYGFNAYDVRFDSAAWSPDGQSLAWSFTGELSGAGDYQAGIVIFDLANHTHRLLYNYNLYAGGEFSYPLAWSSDEAWLAAELHGETPGRRSSTLWLSHMPDGQEFTIQNASGPRWSPDGMRLVYTQWPDPSQGNFTAFDAELVMLEVASRTSETLSLPAGSQILDWVDLP